MFLADPIGSTQMSLSASGTSGSSIKSRSTSTAQSFSKMRGRAIGTTIVPFVPQRIVEQTTGLQFFDVNDKMKYLINQLVSQPTQFAYIQVGRNDPVPIKTATVDVPDVQLLQLDVAERQAFGPNKSGLTIEEITQQQENRERRIAILLGADEPEDSSAVEEDTEIHEEQETREAEDRDIYGWVAQKNDDLPAD